MDNIRRWGAFHGKIPVAAAGGAAGGDAGPVAPAGPVDSGAHRCLVPPGIGAGRGPAAGPVRRQESVGSLSPLRPGGRGRAAVPPARRPGGEPDGDSDRADHPLSHGPPGAGGAGDSDGAPSPAGSPAARRPSGPDRVPAAAGGSLSRRPGEPVSGGRRGTTPGLCHRRRPGEPAPDGRLHHSGGRPVGDRQPPVLAVPAAQGGADGAVPPSVACLEKAITAGETACRLFYSFPLSSVSAATQSRITAAPAIPAADRRSPRIR